MPTLVGVEVGAMKLMISHLQTKTKGGIEVMLTEKHLLRASKFELPNYVLTFVHTRYFAIFCYTLIAVKWFSLPLSHCKLAKNVVKRGGGQENCGLFPLVVTFFRCDSISRNGLYTGHYVRLYVTELKSSSRSGFQVFQTIIRCQER